MGVIMKSSAIRGLVIFAAGAASAALASGMYPKEPITVGQFEERALVLLAEVEALGAYVALAEGGRVGLFIDPIACSPPNPPRPNYPNGSVDSRTLDNALKALVSYNQGLMYGETEPVYVVGRCKPYASSELANLKY
jgi:hypothetical protein